METLISIVEDDEPMRHALCRMLASHQIATADFGSGEEFLEWEELPRASCLIVDGRLPGLSGLAVYRQLARRGYRIPTIMITGEPTSAGRQAALAAGVVAYLGKPFGEDVLLRHIRAALVRAALVRTAPATMGSADPAHGK